MGKVLIVSSTFPRWSDDVEPRFLLDLCQSIGDKYTIHVLAPHYKGAKPVEKFGRVNVFRHKYFFEDYQTLAYQGGILENLKRNKFKHFLVPFFFISQVFSIIKLHRKHQYQLVNLHWIVPQGISGIIAKYFFKSKIPFVLTSHGGDLFALNGTLLTKIKSSVLKSMKHVYVVSSTMKKKCIELGCEDKKVSIRSMGVNLSGQFVDKKTTRKKNSIVFAGRLVEKKGVIYLIRAMELVVQKIPDAQLSIYGFGPQSNQLRKKTTELKLDKYVHFLGAVSHQALAQAYNEHEIMVMPSIVAKSGDQEGLGLTMVEAMGCGCAVIASNLPAVLDVIKHEETGLLFEQKNVENLANHIIHLCLNQEKRAAIAKRGNEFVKEKFDWEQVGEDYSRLFDLATL